MKHYDCISIGTGSAMNVVQGLLSKDPESRIAVIDKDEAGGICLTRACIPSKLLVYPAEVVRFLEEMGHQGIHVDIRKIDFQYIMERMRGIVSKISKDIEKSLKESGLVDYYRETAEFTGPYTMRVGKEEISGDMILLCSGSRPQIPDILGLNEAAYLTSDTLLKLKELPESLTILGGGYVAAEYGHFFSAMGSRVTILGRNPRFLPGEEPEVSAVARQKLSRKMDILTNQEVFEIRSKGQNKVTAIARDRKTGREKEIEAQKILVAAGRKSNSDILRTDRAGIKTDSHGWLAVNDHLETSVRNIWGFGDAVGSHLFKHAANYESRVVYANAVLKEPMSIDYHAVPHGIFTYPEIAAVGMKEAEAVEAFGEEGIAIGFKLFSETARGEAMGAEDCFVKIILEERKDRIVGAHVIGPQATILIQEIINLMYTETQSPEPIFKGMHIHPSLSEVVERAFQNLMLHRDYQHMLSHMFPQL